MQSNKGWIDGSASRSSSGCEERAGLGRARAPPARVSRVVLRVESGRMVGCCHEGWRRQPMARTAERGRAET